MAWVTEAALQKIRGDHPEFAGHLERSWKPSRIPDHIEADALSARMRFHCRDVGPSRWLFAVVSY